MTPSYIYRAQIVNVVDGDTVDAIIDLGFYTSAHQRLRLNGIDTPEMHSSDSSTRERAKLAKEYLAYRVLNREVTLESFGQEKYGRFLAEIYVNSESINKMLISLGHAKPYSGGKKA